MPSELKIILVGVHGDATATAAESPTSDSCHESLLSLLNASGTLHVVLGKTVFVATSTSILAERCNFNAMSGYYHDMLSVVSLSVTRVTRRYKVRSRGFHIKVA